MKYRLAVVVTTMLFLASIDVFAQQGSAEASTDVAFTEAPTDVAFWVAYWGKPRVVQRAPQLRPCLHSRRSYKYGPDDSLTFYIQRDSPGKDKESNWLPAPDGPFCAIYRVYMPGEVVINSTWKKPPMQAVTAK